MIDPHTMHSAAVVMLAGALPVAFTAAAIIGRIESNNYYAGQVQSAEKSSKEWRARFLADYRVGPPPPPCRYEVGPLSSMRAHDKAVRRIREIRDADIAWMPEGRRERDTLSATAQKMCTDVAS